MLSLDNSSCMDVAWFPAGDGRRDESGGNLVVRYLQVHFRIDREYTAVQPFLEKVHQVDVIDSPNRVKVHLRVHKVACQHERFGRLDSPGFKPERRFSGIRGFIRCRTGRMRSVSIRR